MAQSGSNMLSKILRGDEANIATPLPWKSAAGSRPRPVQSSSSPAASPAVPKSVTASGQIVTTHDQVHALQARIAELEQHSERRIREAAETAYREGESAARAQVQPLLEKLARSVQEVADLRPNLRRQAEGDLLRLSLAIARKVIHREVSADPEALTALVRVALEKIRIQEIVRVRTHPQHQPVIRQIVAKLSNGVQIDIQADGRIPLGGIVIDTARGEFDASVDVQLREIERGLADRLASLG